MIFPNDNSPTGLEVSECNATLQGRFFHSCSREPGHKGKHICGEYHNNLQFNNRCLKRWLPGTDRSWGAQK